MYLLTSFKKEFRKNFKIAMPIILSQAGIMLVNFIDNVMISNLGATPLAASSLANGVFFLLMVIGFGFSMAISPLVSYHFEKNEINEVKNIFLNSLLQNGVLGVILLGICSLLVAMVPLLSPPVEIIEMCQDYLWIMALSFIPISLFWTLKHFCESMHKPKIATYAVLTGNAINIFLNYVLMYGKWGFPNYGFMGVAYATLLSRIIMLIVILIYMYMSTDIRFYMLKVSMKHFSMAIQKKIFTLGVSTALQSLFEVSTFSFTTVMVGWIGTRELAAHQIAFNLATLSYIVATAFGAAASIRIGNQMGAKNFTKLLEVSRSLVVSVFIFMGICALGFIFFKEPLVRLYTNTPMVSQIAFPLIIVAAFFQIFDGLQVVYMGILRGMQDKKMPIFIALVSYWCITIPLQYVLAFNFGMSVNGIWYGLFGGLAIISILLYFRFRYLINRLIAAN